jgi:hypothetical protein
MVSARDLIDQYRKRNGLLGLLREFRNRLTTTFSNQATQIWRSAFPNTTVRNIQYRDIPRFFALFIAIYSRAREPTRRRIEPYLNQYRDLYNRYRQISDILPISLLDEFITMGEDLRMVINGENYMTFLITLHEWINRVVYTFSLGENILKPIYPEFYDYYNKMVKTLIDISTDYVGTGGKGAFEFILGTFVHIENFMYEVTNDLQIGTFEPFVLYNIKVMRSLSIVSGYDVVFPSYLFSEEQRTLGYGSIGDWEYLLRISPHEDLSDTDAAVVEKDMIALAAQIGVEVKDDVSELKKRDDQNKKMIDVFPSYFYVIDYLRGVDRVIMRALLPWDYLRYSIEDTVSMFEGILMPRVVRA